MRQIKIIALILGTLILASLIVSFSPRAFKSVVAWYEMSVHYRQCGMLHRITMKFYAEHQADHPVPVASFTTLKESGYLTDQLIKQLTSAPGVYCFFSPVSTDPADPLVGYFSKQDTIIFSVAGKASVFQEEIHRRHRKAEASVKS